MWFILILDGVSKCSRVGLGSGSSCWGCRALQHRRLYRQAWEQVLSKPLVFALPSLPSVQIRYLQGGPGHGMLPLTAGAPPQGAGATRESGENEVENKNNNKKAALIERFPPLQAANLLALSSRWYPQPHWCLVAIALSPTSTHGIFSHPVMETQGVARNSVQRR